MEREEMINIVRENGLDLFKVPKEYKGDKELVLIAIKSNPYAIQYVDEILLDDEEVVEFAARNGFSLKYMPQWSTKKNVIRAVVRVRGGELRFCSHEIQTMSEIIKIAVQNDGMALKFAAIHLQQDYELLKLAIENNAEVLVLINSQHGKHRDLVMRAVRKDGMALLHAHPSMRRYYEICRAAIMNNPRALQYCLLEDDAQMLELSKYVVSKDPLLIKLVRRVLRNNMDFIDFAINCTVRSNILDFLDQLLTLGDLVDWTPERAKACLDKHERACTRMMRMDTQLRVRIPENIHLTVVEADGLNIQYLTVRERTIPICLAACKSDHRAKEFIPASIIQSSNNDDIYYAHTLMYRNLLPHNQRISMLNDLTLHFE